LGLSAKGGDKAGTGTKSDQMCTHVQKDKARRQQQQRAATEARLHRLSEQRDARREEQLALCFQKKSRWGGLSFTWARDSGPGARASRFGPRTRSADTGGGEGLAGGG
jgi:hypothetical protein